MSLDRVDGNGQDSHHACFMSAPGIAGVHDEAAGLYPNISNLSALSNAGGTRSSLTYHGGGRMAIFLWTNTFCYLSFSLGCTKVENVCQC